MKYKPQTKDELIDLIEKNTKFNKIDTSLITDMSGLFKDSMLRNFSGIETWDTALIMIYLIGMYLKSLIWNICFAVVNFLISLLIIGMFQT